MADQNTTTGTGLRSQAETSWTRLGVGRADGGEVILMISTFKNTNIRIVLDTAGSLSDWRTTAVFHIYAVIKRGSEARLLLGREP